MKEAAYWGVISAEPTGSALEICMNVGEMGTSEDDVPELFGSWTDPPFEKAQQPRVIPGPSAARAPLPSAEGEGPIVIVTTRFATRFSWPLVLGPGRHLYKFKVNGEWKKHPDVPVETDTGYGA